MQIGDITELKQGSLNGLYKQANECIENVYKRGYDDGRIAEYQRGLEDGNKIADKDLKEIQDSTYDVAYNKALDDANHAFLALENMTKTEREEWFDGCVGVGNVISSFTIQQIIKFIKDYEEKKKADAEIKVGDEVKSDEAIMIVTRINEVMKTITGIYDGCEYFNRPIANWQKTGRHFDEVEQLFDKLRGEKDEK